MTKKIFLSGIYHETHTFLSQPTTLNDFIINIGDDIIKENKGNGSPTDGFIEFALQKNWDIISGIQMSARPSGIVDEDAENFFDTNFFEKLDKIKEEFNSNGYAAIYSFFNNDKIQEIKNEIDRYIIDIVPTLPNHHVFYEDNSTEYRVRGAATVPITAHIWSAVE